MLRTNFKVGWIGVQLTFMFDMLKFKHHTEAPWETPYSWFSFLCIKARCGSLQTKEYLNYFCIFNQVASEALLEFYLIHLQKISDVLFRMFNFRTLFITLGQILYKNSDT